MIQRVQLQAGSGPDVPGLTLESTPMTVIVGPNNSGKSTLLREIEAWLTEPKKLGNKVLNDLDIVFPNPEDFEDRILELAEDSPAQRLAHDEVLIPQPHNPNKGPLRFRLPSALSQLKRVWNSEPEKRSFFALHYFPLFVARLDGRTRFQLVQPQEIGNLQARPRNFLASLVTSSET